jgi:hypothetical protein
MLYISSAQLFASMEPGFHCRNKLKIIHPTQQKVVQQVELFVLIYFKGWIIFNLLLQTHSGMKTHRIIVETLGIRILIHFKQTKNHETGGAYCMHGEKIHTVSWL